NAALQAPEPQDRDGFGGAVGVSDGTVLVGAQSGPPNAGAAYLFTDSGSGWTETGTLLDGRTGDYFGTTVAISGRRAGGGRQAGGGPPYVYLYRLQDGVAVGRSKLAPSDAGDDDNFGTAVDISGTRALVGAYSHTVGEKAKAGAAYVFTH